MSRALSVDLRVRVLGAVAAGARHREAAERFGVSAASVSRWRKRERDQGDPRPGRLGGERTPRRTLYDVSLRPGPPCAFWRAGKTL